MICCAIVGTSWISEEFYAASLCSDMVLCGVCSRSEEKGRAFAQKIGRPEVEIFTSVEALAASPDIDAVYVASPNSCHAPQCAILLGAGKHVLCEKPVTACPPQLEHLQALARRQGLVFMEAIMYLHTPAHRAVKEALESSALGKITSAHLDFSQLSSRYGQLRAGEVPNVFNPAMAAGAWNDLGVYCVYPALDFFGDPLEFTAQMHLLPTGADGSGTAMLRYAAFPVTLTWSKLGQSQGVSQIMGDEGTLTIRSISQFQDVTLYDRQGNARALAQPLQKHEVMGYEARAFCDYIIGQEPAVPYEEASELSLRVARWMERARGN